MKIIISHDVDHFKFSEHYFHDLIVIKHLMRTYIEKFLGKISWNDFFLRHVSILYNKMNNVKEILAFNESVGVKSTFFFGMNKGLGLSYNYQDIASLVKYVNDRGFEVGVHGIEYNDLDKMKIEFNRFKLVSGLDHFGIRMHYLRHDRSTLSFLADIGYSYDSTLSVFDSAKVLNGIIEFPVHIMDCLIINGSKGFQEFNLEEAKMKTLEIFEEAKIKDINYFSFLFHDCYFSDCFSTWKEWYIWFIKYLIENNYDFITYRDAVNELKYNNNK
jgi:hypothetical protein